MTLPSTQRGGRGVSERLARLALRRPRLVMAGFGLATVLAAPGLTHLVLRTDGNALVPADAPELRVGRELRGDLRALIAVVVERQGEQGVFTVETLGHVAHLTGARGTPRTRAR